MNRSDTPSLPSRNGAPSKEELERAIYTCQRNAQEWRDVNANPGEEEAAQWEEMAAMLARCMPSERGTPWRAPEDKPANLPGEHRSETVLLVMKSYHDASGFVYRLGHVSLGHWRPEGGNGNFDKDILGWQPLPGFAYRHEGESRG